MCKARLATSLVVVSVLAFALVAWSWQVGAGRPEVREKLQGLFPDQEVIDAGQVYAGTAISHIVLTVDKDDVVRVYHWREQPSRGVHESPPPELWSVLGQRVSISGSLDLCPLLPSTEVATQAWRVTHSNGLRSYVVVTWGLDQFVHEAYSIYVFTEELSTRRVTLTHREENLDRELRYFAVQDLTADGSVEIADIGSSDTAKVLRIRTLKLTGDVQLLQEIGGYDIRVFTYPTMDDGRAVIRVEPDKLDPMVLVYKWSSDKQKFLPPGLPLRAEMTWHPGREQPGLTVTYTVSNYVDEQVELHFRTSARVCGVIRDSIGREMYRFPEAAAQIVGLERVGPHDGHTFKHNIPQSDLEKLSPGFYWIEAWLCGYEKLWTQHKFMILAPAEGPIAVP